MNKDFIIIITLLSKIRNTPHSLEDNNIKNMRLFLKQCFWCCKYKKPIYKELTVADRARSWLLGMQYYLFIILEVNPCFSFHKCSSYLHDNSFHCIGTAPPLHGRS